MKKLLTLITILSVLFFTTSALAWNLFFIDQLENIAPGGEPEELGFVLGTHKVSQSSVIIIKNVGVNYMFIYVTGSNALAQEAYSFPEFRGFGYTDMIWRIATGLTNAGTQVEMGYITGAHWYTGGEWYFGNIHEWETAGSPEPVWFGSYRGIFGLDIE